MTGAEAIREIRRTRAQAPGDAARDEPRRRTYVAALAQFEALYKAAQMVDVSVAPLPLFYALSQAGRAIVAAHGAEHRVRGHGLEEGRFRGSPLTSTIRTTADPGLFGAVCELVGAQPPAEVALGACWAALPELIDIHVPDERWPRALRVVPNEDSAIDSPINPHTGVILVRPGASNDPAQAT
jgi:hypothetical protein